MKLHSEREQRAFGLARATQMRDAMTPAERKLWVSLEPLGFQAQVPIQVSREQSISGKSLSIMDFYHPGVHLCVEVDGGIHRKQRGADGRRDRRLLANGIRTMRVTNAQVLRDLPAVLARVEAIIAVGEIHGSNA